MSDEDKRRIGQELKLFIAASGMSREEFAKRAQIGKSTFDKLVTGIYSEKTLNKILDRTKFKVRTVNAAHIIGGYSRLSWEGYICRYLLTFPSAEKPNHIEASMVQIRWSDIIPGLVLEDVSAGLQIGQQIGALWIPHERSPLIYVQPIQEIGVRLVLSTMVGEPFMRGMQLALQRVAANAHIPVAVPVVLKRLPHADQPDPKILGVIGPDHDAYQDYSAELRIVTERQYGRFVDWPN